MNNHDKKQQQQTVTLQEYIHLGQKSVNGGNKMSQNTYVCDSTTQPAPRTLPPGPPAPMPRHPPGRLAPDDGRPHLGFGGWGGQGWGGGALLLGGGGARSTWPRRTEPSPASVPCRRCTAAPVLPIHAPCAPPNAWRRRPRRLPAAAAGG